MSQPASDITTIHWDKLGWKLNYDISIFNQVILVIVHSFTFCQIQKILKQRKFFSTTLWFPSYSIAFLISHGHETSCSSSWCAMWGYAKYMRSCIHTYIMYPMPTNNQIHTFSHACTNICDHSYTYSTYTCEHICTLTHAYTNYAYCTVHAYTHRHLFRLQNNSH